MSRRPHALPAGDPPAVTVGTSDGGLPTAGSSTAPRWSPARLALGFAAGALSHLTLQTGLIAILYAADGPVPFRPWSMAPVPPLGVPVTLSAAFFGGLWGIVYALLEPRFTGLLGRRLGGVAFGAVPLLVFWFLALPLKGLAVGGGFALSGVLVGLYLHAGFGLGTAIIYGTGLKLARRRTVS